MPQQLQNYGSDSLEIVPILQDLAITYGKLGDAWKKTEILERALAIQEDKCGPEHDGLVTTLFQLGKAYGTFDDINKKIYCLERALANQENSCGSEDITWAKIASELATTYGSLGQSGILPSKFTVRYTGGAVCPGSGIGTVFKFHKKIGKR